VQITPYKVDGKNICEMFFYKKITLKILKLNDPAVGLVLYLFKMNFDKLVLEDFQSMRLIDFLGCQFSAEINDK